MLAIYLLANVALLHVLGIKGLVLAVSVALSIGIAIANELTALDGAVLVAISYPLYRFTGRH